MFALADDTDILSDLDLNPMDDCGIDYSPFNSKVHALLFFPVHSPRRVVLGCFAIDIHCFVDIVAFHLLSCMVT